MARGDLVEVTPASYGVMTRAFHFWSGEGRGDETGNLYENFAEATSGKGGLIPEGAFTLDAAENMETQAREEEAKDKEIKAVFVKSILKKRLGSMDGSRSAPGAGARRLSGLREGVMGEEEVLDHDHALDSDEAVTPDDEDVHSGRDRASEWSRYRRGCSPLIKCPVSDLRI
jgi:hypothetical protein